VGNGQDIVVRLLDDIHVSANKGVPALPGPSTKKETNSLRC
jgi:hypothetical protein